MKSKKVLVFSGVALLSMFSVSACGAANSQTASSQPQASTAPTKPAASSTSSANATNGGNGAGTSKAVAKASFTMTVETGKMDGKSGWPEYTPANLTLPANADVTITVNSYDDGNAPIPSGDNKVTGTVDGTMTVDGKSVTSIPTKDVAHTITISSIGLNIPIAVKTSSEKYSATEFTFHTPSKPTTLDWQCMAACGSGSSGWQGAMATDGWMKGTFNVQ
ncbi:hypothetical protein LLE49_12205 [Alicyclobacillus tolerans]|uniref:hypothetical protein n=1 Tax=Alicyclobacillus tolerans TaxID=90970 RepID=UPI001F2F107F|nr:hypothetical protein [Alicyclobacillus tolerans]MCF8565479.1 hypothetical protein [Alicyclobacillus tolerans]